MFTQNGVTFAFLHMGVPTSEPRDGERYSAQFRMYTSDAKCGLFPVQYHRFEAGSSLPEIMRTTPHAAFKVSDLDKAIEGRTVLLGPYDPIDDFRVAVVQDGEACIEFIETTLSDEQIWGRATSGTQASIYRRT